MIYRFGDHTLDTEGFRLDTSGEEIAVEPQVFALLQFLIENRDRVVSKDAIIEHVWDGRIVSDGTLNSRINSARRAVGDDGKAQAVIKTFPRRGFRFVADISGEIDASAESTVAAPSTDMPSIAVLPFVNLSGDPEQEHFSDGITDDIITPLSRIHSFFVIARNSSFSYKGRSPDVRTIAAELDVRYVLEGSVRKAGDRVRITAQLVDGDSGNHVWAESYDREIEDIFTVQDEITQTVVGSIEPELAKAERYKATMLQPESLTAWELYQRGMWHLYQPASIESRDQAEALFFKAIEHDPNFGSTYSALAQNSYIRILQGWSKSSDESDIALKNAQKALELDNTDANAHSCLGAVFIVRKDHARAIRECKAAISLNPSSYAGHHWCGTAFVWSGGFEAGIPMLEMAGRLSPNDPGAGVTLARLAEAYMGLSQYDLAVEEAQLAATKQRRGIWINTSLIATLAHAERMEEAREAYQELIDRAPYFTCAFLKENLPLTDPHLIEV